jgi:uroporphyrin-III C-methyltransferase
MSSAVVFLTAHQASGREAAEWSRLVSSGSTLVIYMPGRDYTSLSAKLRAAQLPGETPCAVISRASTSKQQAHRTTIAELPNAPHLDSPTLLVVGDVVRLANLQEIPGVGEIAEFSSEASSIRVEEVVA